MLILLTYSDSSESSKSIESVVSLAETCLQLRSVVYIKFILTLVLIRSYGKFNKLHKTWNQFSLW